MLAHDTVPVWRTEDHWAPGAGAGALGVGQQVPLLPSHHLHARRFLLYMQSFLFLET